MCADHHFQIGDWHGIMAIMRIHCTNTWEEMGREGRRGDRGEEERVAGEERDWKKRNERGRKKGEQERILTNIREGVLTIGGGGGLVVEAVISWPLQLFLLL